MATGGSAVVQGGGNSVSKLTCAVCLEKFRQPKLLPCFHTFCQRCLQAVAGAALSFPCPACRAIVLLPPGGTSALQTNFYIEQDQELDSTLQVRQCDICSEDIEATHTCLQCCQRYCSSCRKIHDAKPPCHGHTVVPLQPDSPDDRCAKGGSSPQEELCPKHRSQPVLLHCVVCRANICLQCKLTAHDGHKTEDLQDIGCRVKARLKDTLQKLGQQANMLQGILCAVTDRREWLIDVHTSTEQAVKERAVKVKQLVDDCQEHTLSSLHAMNQDLLDSLTATEEGLQQRYSAVTAQSEHITRMIHRDRDTELVDLEANMKELSLDQDQVGQILGSLHTGSQPYLCEHNPLAINVVQLQEFVGILKKSDDKTTNLESHPLTQGPCVPLSPGHNQSVLVPEVDVLEEIHPSVNVMEVIYSKNQRSEVASICSTSEKRAWVMYRPSGEGSVMALFGSQELLKNDGIFRGGLFSAMVTVHKDTTIMSCYNEGKLLWFKTDGLQGTCAVSGRVCTMAKTCKRFLYAIVNFNDYFYCIANVALCKFDVKSVNRDWEMTVLAKMKKIKDFRDVSSCEKYFVFSDDDTAYLYHHSNLLKEFSTYCPFSKRDVMDACFFPVKGREMLLVLVEGINCIHIVDHTDGCNFMQVLDTGLFTLTNPVLLATDQQSVLWVACHGGKMLRIQT